MRVPRFSSISAHSKILTIEGGQSEAWRPSNSGGGMTFSNLKGANSGGSMVLHFKGAPNSGSDLRFEVTARLYN
jgi:hypothetical protein